MSENKYWTTLHYNYTNNIKEAVGSIKEAVRNMNEDVRDLSKYCDALEEVIEQQRNIIKEAIEILEKYNDNENNYYVPVDIVLEILKKENLMNSVLFSRNSDHWKTPTIIYEYYMKIGSYDPCPYDSEFDGLQIEWKEKNFVNPPYSQISKWVDKSIEQNKKGKGVVLLIPARTDTKYFKKLVDYGCRIEFITGRLHFNNSNSVPFPSCYVHLLGTGKTICEWRNRFDGE